MNQPQEPPKPRALTAQQLVILVVIGFGFVGGAILYKFDWASIIIAIFLGTGVASLVYGFLGGIEGTTTFNLGPVKMGGSIAALIGSAWLIDVKLEPQMKLDLQRDLDPPASIWFALEKSRGVPITVRIPRLGDSIPEPPGDVLGANRLGLQVAAAGVTVVSATDPGFTYGSLTADALRRGGLFNGIQSQVGDFIVTQRLRPFTSEVDLDPVELRLSTGVYSGDYSRYALTDATGVVLHEGQIYRRQAEVVKIGQRYYLVAVVEVNHSPSEAEDIYAKFAVGEILPAVDQR